MYITREEVLANREKVIKFLLQPKRQKAVKYLDIGSGQRCCLGHMCYVLSIPVKRYGKAIHYGVQSSLATAPDELLKAVGLYNNVGRPSDSTHLVIAIKGAEAISTRSLALANDHSKATPQDIGRYLQSVIKGGPTTPWKPLTDYPKGK